LNFFENLKRKKINRNDLEKYLATRYLDKQKPLTTDQITKIIDLYDQLEQRDEKQESTDPVLPKIVWLFNMLRFYPQALSGEDIPDDKTLKQIRELLGSLQLEREDIEFILYLIIVHNLHSGSGNGKDQSLS